MNRHIPALLMLVVLLAACSKHEEQPAPKLFQDQREALDKAKTVDPMVQKLDEEQRKAIEQQAH